MNFNNNTMLYPKKDELNPTKDDGVNPSFYPKEEGFNPFNGIVERIKALESITQNYEDSFETKELTVTENAQIENLNATKGTVNRLNSVNVTVTNLNSTNATVINADVENAQIENLNATEGTVDTLNSTTSTITNLNSTTSTVTNGNIKNAKVESLNATEGKINTLESTNATVTNLNSTNATVNTLNSTTSTVTNLNSTNGNIKNAEVENLNATEGTVDTLESTTSTVTNGNIKNAKVENLNVTKNAEIKKLHATEGTVDTLNLTNCNIKNADIENLHTNKLTWDLPNIDVINAETIKLHATEGTVDTLNSTNGNIINAEVEKLNVTTEIKVENFKTEEPIFSNAVVGYDENGKMIPIRFVAPTASYLYFDYTVDSQQKFNNLLSILKSGIPNTYRSIAIIGGLGDGEHGEYLYTVDSNSSDANLNNASFIGLNNPKIVITTNNANTFKVFKNGLIKDIDFNVGGTVNAGKTVTLLYNCTYNNGKIALNNVSANFNIVNTSLSNVVNDECKSFVGCTLNDCETIQSAFTNCSSEMLYVSTDTNIANKYSFNKCGIHLDMKKADMAQLETVTINIASMTDSKLTVLDTSSKLKKIILNVDASDSLSEIIGNNDKKYSIYEPYVKRVSKSISPSMRSKAYLSYHDESHTPIFSNDGVKFYLDEAMTQQVYCYSTTNSNNERIWMFALGNDDTHCYSSLTLNKEITYSQRDGESVAGLKLSDFGDEFILNGNSLKTYICRNDESGTLLYSNNNGTDIYISPYINDDNKVQYANPNTSSKLFMIGQFSYLTKNLGAFNAQPSFSDLNFATPQLLEVTALKDNYAVQVVSNYDVPIYVENAFNTKVKNN